MAWSSSVWNPEVWEIWGVNDDLLVSWDAQALDIGGQPSNVLGYKIYDMRSAPVEIADVAAPLTSQLIVGFIGDPSLPHPVAVSAYNAVGEGEMSDVVVAGPPAASVPAKVMGVQAVIVPK